MPTAVFFSASKGPCSICGSKNIPTSSGAQWQLPEKLIAVVKYHHQPFAQLDLPTQDKTLIAIVSLADFICWTQGMGSFACQILRDGGSIARANLAVLERPQDIRLDE